MPNSVCSPCTSSAGLAEKRMLHPPGSSELKGMPDPPPVRSPTSNTPGRVFMYMAKELAALKVRRLMSTATGFCHRNPLRGLRRTGFGVENASCAGPVLCMM